MGNAFLYDSGGGGANLKLDITSGVQPTVPTENMIWVNAENVTGYVFSDTQPESTKSGLVWIVNDTDNSTSGLKALSTNNASILLYPATARQYINGEWVKKDAKLYQSGKWIDLGYRLDVVPNITDFPMSAWTIVSIGASFDESGAISIFPGTDTGTIPRYTMSIGINAKKYTKMTVKARVKSSGSLVVSLSNDNLSVASVSFSYSGSSTIQTKSVDLTSVNNTDTLNIRGTSEVRADILELYFTG